MQFNFKLQKSYFRISQTFSFTFSTSLLILLPTAMDSTTRKFQIEKKILQELYEVRRLQQRASKVNEDILVKRISEGYKKSGLSIDFREFSGPYTFSDFEKYLNDQLNLLRSNRRRHSTCNSESSDDIERLAEALKKMNSTKLPFMLEELNKTTEKGNQQYCSENDKTCHHTTNAYTGVPCAYFDKGRRGSVPYSNYKRLNLEDPNKQINPKEFSKDPLIRRLIDAEDNKPTEVKELLKDQQLLKGLVNQNQSITASLERKRSLRSK